MYNFSEDTLYISQYLHARDTSISRLNARIKELGSWYIMITDNASNTVYAYLCDLW